MTAYNLLDEGWLPCITTEGLARDFPLREALLHAHEIREVADPSPLATITLHRLFLAILHRVFGPEGDLEWDALWHRGSFDPVPLNAYLDRWRSRFDLFDADYPFYQVATLEVGPDSTAYKLTYELGSSNAKLFSHTDPSNPPALTAPEAARAVVTSQAFAPPGTIARWRGPGPTSARGGPLIGVATCLVLGESLFETLMLNLVRYSPRYGRPFSVEAGDAPAWEREPPLDSQERRPTGYLDWLTWQSRGLHLIPERHGTGIVVRRAAITKGTQLPADAEEMDYEQMTGYKQRKNAKRNEDPWLVVNFRRDRAVWRDSLALFQSTTSTQRPRTFDELANHIEFGSIPDVATFPLALFGIALDQANALFWRRDRLPLPSAFLSDKALYSQLQHALQFAEEVGTALGGSVRQLAGLLLAPESDAGGRQADRDVVTDLVQGMAPTLRYWSQLEGLFAQYLDDQAADIPISGNALRTWAGQVMTAARNSFNDIANGLGGSGRALHATVLAEQQLARRMTAAHHTHIPDVDRERKSA